MADSQPASTPDESQSISEISITSDTTTVPINNSPEVWGRTPLTFNDITKAGSKIRLVDSDPNIGQPTLDLYCYVKANENETSLVRSCRGVLVRGDKVVLQTYAYTTEIISTDTEKLVSSVSENLEGCRIFEAHEGSLLRIFNVEDKWFLSTHRKLDANRSKWASRQSFGELFVAALAELESTDPALRERLGTTNGESGQDLLEKFYTNLDPKCCYCFLVRNTSENRIVCQPPTVPTMYHVGTFDTRFPVSDERSFSLDVDIGIQKPHELTISTREDLVTTVNNMSENELQGALVVSSTGHVKLVNPEYAKLFAVRGNEPSVKYRYLQVRMDTELTDKLYQLYPRYTDTFEQYENTLYCVAQKIYDAYVNRFIKKIYVTVPKEEYQVIRACHAWHLIDRTRNRISLRKVIEKLNEQVPTSLNKMIRHMNQEEEGMSGGIQTVLSSNSISSMSSAATAGFTATSFIPADMPRKRSCAPNQLRSSPRVSAIAIPIASQLPTIPPPPPELHELEHSES